MSGAIDTALRTTIFEIGRTLLLGAFKYDLEDQFGYQVNLREAITNKIIYEQVLADLSLVAPQEIWLPLSESYVKMREGYKVVFTIPDHVTGGRRIISPLQIAYKTYIPNQYSGTTTHGAAARTINHTPDISGLVTTDIQMLGAPNTFLMPNFGPNPLTDYALEVTVAHDDNFSAIPPVWYLKFAELVTLKTKAYLYANKREILDRVEYGSGASISSVKSQLDEFSDANESYKEEVKKWLLYKNLYDENALDDMIQLTTGFY